MSQIVEKLKQIQADSAVFYIKLHNYHWNVKGMDFHPVHSALEAMYDEVTEQMDEVAERVLQIGEKPYVTLKDMLAASQIKEDSNTSFTSKDIVKIILPDYEYFLKSFRELSDLAGCNSHNPSTNLPCASWDSTFLLILYFYKCFKVFI